MSNFVQDNGGMLAVLAVCFAIGAGYLEWRISVNTSDAIDAAGAVTPAQLQLVANTQSEIRQDIDDLKANDTRFDSKLDRIIDILLED